MRFSVRRTKIVIEEGEVRARNKREALKKARNGELEIRFEEVESEYVELELDAIKKAK